MGTVCPHNGFLFGNSSCACAPGYYLDPGTTECILYPPASGTPESESTGLSNYTVKYFLREFIAADRVTAVQTWVLIGTAVLAGLWLALCFLVRKAPLKDGRSAWFRWRYWISRLDFAFANHHWVEDQKVQVKRSTELGGAFSVAAWIFFLGVISSLVYEFAADRQANEQNIRAANVEEIASFGNDIEINITTVSSMSCAQLRGLDSLFEGTPGSVSMRRTLLSEFANATCYNATRGPMVQLSCQSCYLDRDRYYIPWYFVDSPGVAASAVGFEFALLASPPSNRNRISFVSGELSAGLNRSGSTSGTIRGREESVFEFAFVPHIDKGGKWKLMESSLHRYVPGTIFTSSRTLQASYENPADGFLNVTVQLDVQSTFLIESSAPTTLGPATFLARLGGLYTISICFFYVLMREFEYRVKLLRFDDKILNKMRAREKARLRWGKVSRLQSYIFPEPALKIYVSNAMVRYFMALVNQVRLFVKYRALRDAHNDKLVGKSSGKEDNFQQKMMKTLSKIGSSTKRAFKNEPPEKVNTVIPGLDEDKIDSSIVNITNRQQNMGLAEAGDVEADGDREVPPGVGTGENGPVHEGDLDREKQPAVEGISGLRATRAEGFLFQFRSPAWALIKEPLPPAPDLNIGEDEGAGYQMDVGDLQQKLRHLHEWNTRLRADLLNTQRVLDEVIRLFRPHRDF